MSNEEINHQKLSANPNPLDNNSRRACSGERGFFHPLPPYLVEFPIAVFLSLWNVKDLVHVRSPLLPGHSGEEQARHQKVGAAESGKDVAFEFFHGSQRTLAWALKQLRS